MDEQEQRMALSYLRRAVRRFVKSDEEVPYLWQTSSEYALGKTDIPDWKSSRQVLPFGVVWRFGATGHIILEVRGLALVLEIAAEFPDGTGLHENFVSTDAQPDEYDEILGMMREMVDAARALYAESLEAVGASASS